MDNCEQKYKDLSLKQMELALIEHIWGKKNDYESIKAKAIRKVKESIDMKKYIKKENEPSNIEDNLEKTEESKQNAQDGSYERKFVCTNYTNVGGMKPLDLIEEISKPKGKTFVRLNSTGQTIIVDRDNGTGKDIYMTQNEHQNTLKKKSTNPHVVNYDFEMPSFLNGRKVGYEDNSVSRNTASDKEFKRVDPCSQRNKQEEDFFHNINNIK